MAQSIVKTEDILKCEFGENISLQPLGEGVEIYVSKNHTFGTDAVLLADFASQKKVKTQNLQRNRITFKNFFRRGLTKKYNML